MLFNSYVFIFLFMPFVGIIYYLLGKRNQFFSALWLMAASLFFYAWWSVEYLWLLLASIYFNYVIGRLLDKLNLLGQNISSGILLGFAITANLLLLGYYKYANFFLDTLNHFSGGSHHIMGLILPMGISFFTFTQIAFLVDVWKKKAQEYKFIHYTLFVTYFPHLIAGPIIHHSEIMPQFRNGSSRQFIPENLSVGLMIFIIGLFKKVIVADGVGVYVDPVFHAAGSGILLTFVDAWCGALAYTFQLYFDFSGYSDMAIGISRIFGIKLPINFYSPYKANNIIVFWRRWHITLSRFLRDYLYFPLGGNRKGKLRRYINLMITMMLGGLWHGASWTFVIWGSLHGVYLVINHGWNAIHERVIGATNKEALISRLAGRILTFIAVVVAWVFFRAENTRSAFEILKAMSGQNGVQLPLSWSPLLSHISTWFEKYRIHFGELEETYRSGEFSWLLILLIGVWILPNTYQIMKQFNPALALTEEVAIRKPLRFLEWKPNVAWAVMSCIFMVFVVLNISKETVFLYYQF